MYSLVFKRQAARYYKKTSSNIKNKLNILFDRLSSGDFRSLDIKPLKGEFGGVLRIRIGDLRVFIEFVSKNTINILMIKPRGDTY